MRKYRSLVGWQRARALTIATLKATDAAYHPRARALFDQIRRAVISVEANIVEGYRGCGGACLSTGRRNWTAHGTPRWNNQEPVRTRQEGHRHQGVNGHRQVPLPAPRSPSLR